MLRFNAVSHTVSEIINQKKTSKMKEYKEGEFEMTTQDKYEHLAKCPECHAAQYHIQYLGCCEGSWYKYYKCNKCGRMYVFIDASSAGGGASDFLKLIAHQ